MLPLLSGRHIQEETFGCYFKNKYIKAIDNIAHRDETYLFSYGRKKNCKIKVSLPRNEQTGPFSWFLVRLFLNWLGISNERSWNRKIAVRGITTLKK